MLGFGMTPKRLSKKQLFNQSLVNNSLLIFNVLRMVVEKSFRSKDFRHKSKIGSFLAPRNAEPALYSALKTCKYVDICV